MIPLIGVMSGYWAFVSDDEELNTTYFEVALFTVWYVLLYVRTAKHVGDTVKA